ncbi:leucine-rich repeat domain-containing protein [Skeletonema marinoi]|uniref:Leucine-rich repeat domain-containing protein n=1 Tax=Skeletonema marinoi TaxID=267567 RepID=A0AAD8Y3N1_9STRA|nr:leucine-rich repeat domain-containing protein [Skeletonema marinoi]
MADHADDGNDYDGDVFVYRGGRAPRHITHVRIDESVDVIKENAFNGCEDLVQVETHDGIRKVGQWAFLKCISLRQISLKHVVEIDGYAFYFCENLADVEFGDNLETIGERAFDGCCSLEHLKLPSIITIGMQAFWKCKALKDVEFSERLETIESNAFYGCDRLEGIAIPLKRDMFPLDWLHQKYDQFDGCDQLKTVDLVGGITKLLHRCTWKVGELKWKKKSIE